MMRGRFRPLTALSPVELSFFQNSFIDEGVG
jgi:hypothetical protein